MIFKRLHIDTATYYSMTDHDASSCNMMWHFTTRALSPSCSAISTLYHVMGDWHFWGQLHLPCLTRACWRQAGETWWNNSMMYITWIEMEDVYSFHIISVIESLLSTIFNHYRRNLLTHFDTCGMTVAYPLGLGATIKTRRLCLSQGQGSASHVATSLLPC